MNRRIQVSTGTFIERVAISGMIAGALMGMWTMIVEAFLPSGTGFWSPMNFIAATVLRYLQNVSASAGFDLAGVVVGVLGHMMNSIIFALIFAYLIAPRIHSMMGEIVAGIVYGILIYVVMWYAVVPLIDPVMLNLNSLVFFIGHLIFGGVLGAMSYWVIGQYRPGIA